MDEFLLPAVMQKLDEAHGVAFLRCLRAEKDAGKIRKVFSQMLEAGKAGAQIVWQNVGRPAAEMRAAEVYQRMSPMKCVGMVVLAGLASAAVAAADDSVAGLIKQLQDDKLEVRLQAADALANLGPDAKEAIPALTAALKGDKEAKVRAYAAFALKKMGAEAKEAVPALTDALKDKDEEVRSVAADALGQLGADAKSAVPALAEALKDPDSGPHAAQALGRIGPDAKDALPALTAALQDSAVRPFAAQTIGSSARPACRLLTKALEDKDDDVRLYAVLALRLVGPDADSGPGVGPEGQGKRGPSQRGDGAGQVRPRRQSRPCPL